MPLSRLKQRVHSSLRLKLALLLSVVTAFLTITFTSYYIANERNTYRSRLEDKGNLLATILADSLQLPLYAGQNEEVAWQASQIFTYGEVAALKVFTSSGELLASADAYNSRTGETRLTVVKPVVTSTYEHTPAALLFGESHPDQRIGVIELTMDQSHLARLTSSLVLSGILLGLLFWMTTTALTFFMLRRVTRTFHQLMAGVRNIEGGDLSTRIPASGTDEPGRALAAINSLADALQKKHEENLKLQAEIVKGLRTQLDEEKTRNMAKLIQTNRMTSLGLLVSSMAHEINNPNGAIRLAAEFLNKACKDILPILNETAEHEGALKICGMPYSDAIEDIESAVETISRSSSRIELVVTNLRTYSLGDREARQIEFDLNRVAENAVAIVRAHGKVANIIIKTDLSAALPAIRGNPFQIEQVVVNLLMNAIQATQASESRSIIISTLTAAADNEVQLHVKDSGPGIAPENLAHIFEPFFSTRFDQGGSGLGLYISRYLIMEQNGMLEIFNDESGGCRAVIRLKTPSLSPLLPASC